MYIILWYTMVIERNTDLEIFFSGENLYGEDFDEIKIKTWYEEEINAYSDIGSGNFSEKYIYSYHGINWYHGFSRFIKNKNQMRVLAIGGYFGDELLPIIDHVSEILILEPSSSFPFHSLNNINIQYIQANYSGKIPIESDSIDLITCFGCLHHIPKISIIIDEINRIIKPKGIVMIREPIISMGDWTKTRKGLTKNERGIPRHILKSILVKSKFNILYERMCFFSINSYFLRVMSYLNVRLYNSVFFVYFDDFICNIPPWKVCYHPRYLLKKIQPTSIFFVLQKQEE